MRPSELLPTKKSDNTHGLTMDDWSLLTANYYRNNIFIDFSYP